MSTVIEDKPREVEMFHYLDLVIEAGEVHPAFRCASDPDAPCRRRPLGDRHDAEFFTYEEATDPGYQCWAEEWVDAVGILDAIYGDEDGILASTRVSVNYDDGVHVTPIKEDERVREN